MQNQLRVFENAEFGKVRVVEIDGQAWFVGRDVSGILGYGNGSRDINRHVDPEDRQIYRNGTSEINNRGVIAINEPGLYSLIIGSKLPAAKAFKRWVTSEVLPSIRKHGAYMTDDALRRISEGEGYIDVLLRRLVDEKSKNDSLNGHIEEMAPKAHYCDAILQCENAVQAGIIAKDYGMGTVAFNKLLHGLKVQFKTGETWVLYKEHAGKGYTVTRTYHASDRISKIHTYWTQKGRRFLYDLLKWYGIVPAGEKSGCPLKGGACDFQP